MQGQMGARQFGGGPGGGGGPGDGTGRIAGGPAQPGGGQFANRQPQGQMGGGPRQPGAGGGAPLSEDQILQRLIGNTLDFASPIGGQQITLYFAEGGKLEQRIAGVDQLLTRRWFFDNRGLFCRSTNRPDRNHCVRVRAGAQPDILTMFNRRFSYEARVTQGRALQP